MHREDPVGSKPQLYRPMLLGHRGSRNGVQENSLAAFNQALEDGCDGFEFDVRLSADCCCVICHAPRLFGTEVARSSFAELLAASRRKKLLDSPTQTDSSGVLCLEDVLASYHNRAYLDIELKVSGLEEVALALLARFSVNRGIVISSFLPEVLRKLSDLDSRVSLGFIFEDTRGLRQWDRLPVSHLMPRHTLIEHALLSEFHAAGKQVFAWTVNNPQEMRALAEFGVDGLISDDTRLLCDVFRGQRRIG